MPLLRSLVRKPAQQAEELSDGECVTRFVKSQDQQAFRLLVERHSQMVFATAIRLVRDAHAAEDVTQATFLVLARDGKKLRNRDAVAGWLHGIAMRLAKKSLSRRQRAAGSPMIDEPSHEPSPLKEIGDVYEQQVLDEELQRLPEHFRDALVMHFLEGLTYDQTAAALNVSTGVIEGRIKRGKRELHLRMVRRGIEFGAVMVAIGWSQRVAQAALQPDVLSTIVENGVAVAQGTAFTAEFSSEAVHLAGKEVAMVTSTKITIAACGVMMAAAAGWVGHSSVAGEGKPTAGTGSNALVATQVDSVAADSKRSDGQVDDFERLFAGGEEGLDGQGGGNGGGDVDVFGDIGGINTGKAPGGGYGGSSGGGEYIVEVGGNTRQSAPTKQVVGKRPGASAMEKQIVEKLNEPIAIEFIANPLSDVANFLSEQLAIPVLLDHRALEEIGVSPDEEIELVISNVTCRSALNLLLREHDLTYVIRDETLQITSVDVADSLLETRVYDVNMVAREEIRHLMTVIKATVGTGASIIPNDSEEYGMYGGDAYEGGGGMMGMGGGGGGPLGDGGSIPPYFGDQPTITSYGGQLVIKETQAHHAEIEKLLNSLIENKDVSNSSNDPFE